MPFHRAFSRRRPAATRLLAAALLAVVAIGGCTEKEADFFASLDPTPTLGSIDVRVTGTPNGASVRLTGNGLDETQVFGAIGSSFSALDFGIYNLEVMPPSNFGCTPPSATVQITAASRFPEVVFACEPVQVEGATLRFTTTGLPSGTTFLLEITGGATLSGQLGADGLEFNGLDPETYNYVFNTSLYDCVPGSGSATLTAGQELVIAIACSPTTGEILIQVAGLGSLSATVDWSGPQSGSGTFGSTPSTISGLLPGTYTVTPMNPLGADCGGAQDVGVTAGGTGTVSITCVAVLIELLIDISAVPSGPIASISLPLRDGGGTLVGAIIMVRDGANSFWGNNPFRLGFGDGAITFFQVTGVVVDATPLAVAGITFTTDNTPLNGTDFVEVGYLDGTATPISVDQVTTANTNFWGTNPVGTEFVGIRTSGTGFFVDLLNWKIVGTRQFD